MKMVVSYACRDVGVDCDWSASAETEEDLMGLIAEHAKTAHPDIELTPDLVATVKAAFKYE
jgi:predicted small metal-binding protein